MRKTVEKMIRSLGTDVTVRKSSTNAASRCLRHQADLLISPYSKDRFACRGV